LANETFLSYRIALLCKDCFMPTKQNRKEAAVADINFVLSECVRLHELIRNIKPSELPSLGPWGTLPLPGGAGEIPCSTEALYRLHNLASVALKQSDASGTVEPEKVFRALRHVVQRFMKEQRTPNSAQVERALAAAVREAKRLRSDAVHFIPCRLMHVSG